jgi:hypothetical protein
MTHATEPKAPHGDPGISLELPGVKVSFTGRWAVVTLAALVVLIASQVAFMVSAKTESVRSVITSLNAALRFSVSF